MDKVLSYYDVFLREEDLELLEDGRWLNDQVIAFFFEWLQQEAFPNLDPVLLVTGASAFLLAHTQGAELIGVLQSMKLPEKELVLFAVNDNPYIEQPGGGSHWSLLAYSAHNGVWRHYDSAAGSNRNPARSLSAKVNAALRGIDSKLAYEDAACPQQHNGYDCGVYVLAIAQLLCQRFQQDGSRMEFAVSASDLTQASVTHLRQDVKMLIAGKAIEQQRQQ